MKKVLTDRLNHLKSEYSQLTVKKLDRDINWVKVDELLVRINEVEWLLDKLK